MEDFISLLTEEEDKLTFPELYALGTALIVPETPVPSEIVANSIPEKPLEPTVLTELESNHSIQWLNDSDISTTLSEGYNDGSSDSQFDDWDIQPLDPPLEGVDLDKLLAEVRKQLDQPACIWEIKREYYEEIEPEVPYFAFGDHNGAGVFLHSRDIINLIGDTWTFKGLVRFERDTSPSALPSETMVHKPVLTQVPVQALKVCLRKIDDNNAVAVSY